MKFSKRICSVLLLMATFNVFAYDTVFVKPSDEIKKQISELATQSISEKLTSNQISKSDENDIHLEGIACFSHAEFKHIVYYCTSAFSTGGGTLGVLSLKYDVMKNSVNILDWTVD